MINNVDESKRKVYCDNLSDFDWIMLNYNKIYGYERISDYAISDYHSNTIMESYEEYKSCINY